MGSGKKLGVVPKPGGMPVPLGYGANVVSRSDVSDVVGGVISAVVEGVVLTFTSDFEAVLARDGAFRIADGDIGEDTLRVAFSAERYMLGRPLGKLEL